MLKPFSVDTFLTKENLFSEIKEYKREELLEILKNIHKSNIETYLLNSYGCNSIFNLKLQCIITEYIYYIKRIKNKELTIANIEKTKSWFDKKYKSLVSYKFNKYDLLHFCQLPDFIREKINLDSTIVIDFYIDLLNRYQISKILLSKSNKSVDQVMDEVFNIISNFKEYIIEEQYGKEKYNELQNTNDEEKIIEASRNAVFSLEIFAKNYFTNVYEELKKEYNLTNKDVNEIGYIDNDKPSLLYKEKKDLDLFNISSNLSKKLYKKLEKVGIRNYLDTYTPQYNDIKQYYLDFIAQQYLEYIKSKKPNKKIAQKDIDTYDDWLIKRLIKLNKYNYNSQNTEHITPIYLFLSNHPNPEKFEIEKQLKTILETLNRYGIIKKAMIDSRCDETPGNFIKTIETICLNCILYCIGKKYKINTSHLTDDNSKEYSLDPFDILYYSSKYLESNWSD